MNVPSIPACVVENLVGFHQFILRTRPRSPNNVLCLGILQKRPVQEGSKIKDGSNFKMEVPGLKCGAADCDFSTPDFGPDLFPTMVAHLQVSQFFCDTP